MDPVPAQQAATLVVAEAAALVHTPSRVSWANITRRPGKAPLPAGFKEKVDNGLATLRKSGFQPLNLSQNAVRPRSTPLYFDGIPRCPIHALRKSL